ncbi:MAG: YicC family protein [Lentisphaeria bacterium]|nr:YicC family protein [Lentisphaeria bacterium]
MRSMTGFGKAEGQYGNTLFFSIEISSVNRKQLELRCSLPPELSGFENLVRQKIGSFISRGAVSIKVAIRKSSNAGFKINTDVLYELINTAKEARMRAGLPVEVNVEQLMQLPNVIVNSGDSGENPALTEAFSAALENAGKDFIAMRYREGEALKADLSSRTDLLEDLLRQIEPLAAKVPEIARKRLYCKLAAEKLQVEPNDELFAREMLFYLDKSDVTEEITRLKSHFVQLRKFFEASEPAGRGMDFLLQEFFREITTLGNKAPSPELSTLVVKFKTELEKLREQVQNVE